MRKNLVCFKVYSVSGDNSRMTTSAISYDSAILLYSTIKSIVYMATFV